MTRLGWLAAFGLLVAGCSKDPIVGRWGAGGKVVEFHRDGRITGIQRDDPECTGETETIAACAQQQRWERWDGAYQLTIMTVVRSDKSGIRSMFAGQKDVPACVCVVDITGTAEVRGDELAIDGGKERLQRVE